MKTQNLIIIGARGGGRQVYNLAMQCKGLATKFRIKGFLDDKADALDGFSNYAPILGAVETYVVQPHDVFVCSLGEPKFKRYYIDMIRQKGGMFRNLIHPNTVIFSNTVIGTGCIMMPNVYISCDIKIEDFVTIQPFCSIGHDAQIGAFSYLNAFSFMGGGAKLEEGVTLYPGATVLPHKTIGAWATVGVGSVVLGNVASGVTVFGLPATKISA